MFSCFHHVVVFHNGESPEEVSHSQTAAKLWQVSHRGELLSAACVRIQPSAVESFSIAWSNCKAGVSLHIWQVPVLVDTCTIVALNASLHSVTGTLHTQQCLSGTSSSTCFWNGLRVMLAFTPSETQLSWVNGSGQGGSTLSGPLIERA